MNPKYADAYYNKGLAHLKLYKYNNAVFFFDKAI